MKARVSRILLFAVLAALSGIAQAHGSVRFGIGIGIPAPWYYPPAPYYYPYPYYPPAVVVPSAPPAYVEQAPSEVYSTPAPSAAAPSGRTQYYYCPSSKGYYPYVRECPDGWQTLPAQPPK
jgi:hypothetical protein